MENFSLIDPTAAIKVATASKVISNATNKSGIVLLIAALLTIGILWYLWIRSQQAYLPKAETMADVDLK